MSKEGYDILQTIIWTCKDIIVVFWTLYDYDDDPIGGHMLKLNSIRGIDCLCAISRRGWCVQLHGTKGHND